MTDQNHDMPTTDGVDFEIAVTDPAAYYGTPDDVSADPELTAVQRRRFLMEWAQDVEDRQAGVEEGMGAGEISGSDQDAKLLQRIRDCIARLPDDDPEQLPGSALTRFWRRLVAG